MSVEVKEATSMVARILIPAHHSLCLCKVLFGNCRVYWCVHKRLSLCVCVCSCQVAHARNPSVNQSLKVKTATNTDTHWQQVAISSISSEDLLLDCTFQSDNYKNWSRHLGRPSWCCEVALFRQCFKTHHLCSLLSPTALWCALLQRHVDSKLGVHKVFPMKMNYLPPKVGGGSLRVPMFYSSSPHVCLFEEILCLSESLRPSQCRSRSDKKDFLQNPEPSKSIGRLPRPPSVPRFCRVFQPKKMMAAWQRRGPMEKNSLKTPRIM